MRHIPGARSVLAGSRLVDGPESRVLDIKHIVAERGEAKRILDVVPGDAAGGEQAEVATHHYAQTAVMRAVARRLNHERIRASRVASWSRNARRDSVPRPGLRPPGHCGALRKKAAWQQPHRVRVRHSARRRTTPRARARRTRRS